MPEISDDVHELARKIYRKHKKAIDLICEHRDRYEPNYVTEGFRMVREAVRNREDLKERQCNHPYARFVSADWDAYEVLKIDSFPSSQLLFDIHVTDHGAKLSLLFAKRGSEDLKRTLYNRVSAAPGLLKGPLPEYVEDNYNGLPLGVSILESSDYEHWWDEEKIRQTISDRLDDFAQGQFQEINRIVLECLEKHRSEKPQSEEGEKTQSSD